MPTFLLRVWLPDRPGALGSVASQIGAVRGDLIGIDILERDGGRAIDELTISLPDARLADELIEVVRAIDGVAVEDLRPVVGEPRDPRLDALETAAALLETDRVDELLGVLAARAARDFAAEWSVVVDLAGPEVENGPDGGLSPTVLVSEGSAPSAPWLAAFVVGTRSAGALEPARNGPADVAWAPLDVAELVVVVGRSRQPYHARERRQLAAIARIADRRWQELVHRDLDRGRTAPTG